MTQHGDITHADWCPFEVGTQHLCLQCHLSAAKQTANWAGKNFGPEDRRRETQAWEEKHGEGESFKLTPG